MSCRKNARDTNTNTAPPVMNCPMLCGIQKQANLLRGDKPADAEDRFSVCLGQCDAGQESPQTPYICLLNAPNLTPETFDATLKSCQH